tara:strand:- start:2580 stop:3527 length:948 start_codon:yes stop_codon:yes gene_type:complete
MRTRTLTDFQRHNDNFRRNQVLEILPEYYQADYPFLLTFLEEYYSYLDSDETFSAINELFGIRDIERTQLKFLDQIFSEVGGGAGSGNFTDAREALRNFANYFRVKGTLFSSEGFFRAFFGEEVEVIYPKKDLFIVDDSLIGPQSIKFIQNGQLYQIFSILIKSSIPLNQWSSLYKKFVHPAGWFLGAEVSFDTKVSLSISTPDVIEASVTDLIISSTSSPFGIFGKPYEMAVFLPDGTDSDGTETIIRHRRVSEYANVEVDELVASYGQIAPNPDGLLDINSPTFDEDSGRPTGAVRVSNTVETMDFDRFEDYL